MTHASSVRLSSSSVLPVCIKQKGGKWAALLISISTRIGQSPDIVMFLFTYVFYCGIYNLSTTSRRES